MDETFDTRAEFDDYPEREERSGWIKVKLSLRRVYLNAGGYTRNGTYYGVGAPLYEVASDDFEVSYCLRAYDRTDARAKVLSRFRNAKVRV